MAFSSDLKQAGVSHGALGGRGEVLQAAGADHAEASGGSPRGEHEGSTQKPLPERPGGRGAVTLSAAIRVLGHVPAGDSGKADSSRASGP